MKYKPQYYARAFFEASASAPEEKQGVLISNFFALLEKNGDISQASKIVCLAEKMMIKKSGRRMLLVESARPLSGVKAELEGLIKNDDVVEEVINPAVIAGVRITINEEKQFDGSLKRKLENMFVIVR